MGRLLLALLLALPLAGQSSPASGTPGVANFLCAGVTLTPASRVHPTFSYARKISDAANGLYSFSDYSVLALEREPLSLQIVSLTGLAAPLKRIGPARWKVTWWGAAQAGVAQGSENVGFAWGLGSFLTVPVKTWFVVVPGVKPVKSALSGWQAEYRLSIGKGWD